MSSPDLTRLPVNTAPAAGCRTRSGREWPVRPARVTRRRLTNSDDATTPWSLSNVPTDLMHQITRQLASPDNTLASICKQVINWCHTAKATNCGLNDDMFRSLLVVFGLPSEWLDIDFANRFGVQVVPDHHEPFPSWWVLWITLCKTFNGTTFWLQNGFEDIDAHSRERRRYCVSTGPGDPFELRDVLLDSTSGIRVRASACNALDDLMRWYPDPEDGIYRLPPDSSASASARRRCISYDIRMQNVAMHWLMTPAEVFAEHAFIKVPQRHPWDKFDLWRRADQALNNLLRDPLWFFNGELQESIQESIRFDDVFPMIASNQHYIDEYVSDPVRLADYLINTLDAAVPYNDASGLQDASMYLDQAMNSGLTQDETQHGIVTADLEDAALLRIFHMVVDAQIRGRRIWTFIQWWDHDWIAWLTVLQTIKIAMISTVPESFSGTNDAFSAAAAHNGPHWSVRPLDKQIVEDMQIFVNKCPDVAHLSDIGFDSIKDKLARKYGGDDDTTAAARHVILRNQDRIAAALHPLSKQKALQYWPADDRNTILTLHAVVDAHWRPPDPLYILRRKRVEERALLDAHLKLGIPLEMFPDELATIVKNRVRHWFGEHEYFTHPGGMDRNAPDRFPGPYIET